MQNKSKNMENPPLSYQDLLDKVYQYQVAGDFPKAIELLEPAIKDWKVEKDVKYTQLLFCTAVCYGNVSEHHKSIELLHESLKVYKELNQSPSLELLSALGKCYFGVLEFKTGAKWLLQCLLLAEKQQNVDMIANTQGHLGACYYQLINYKMAYKFLSASIELQEVNHLDSSNYHTEHLRMLIRACEQLKLQEPHAKYLKLKLDLMKKNRHSPIQEYSDTLISLVLAKMALSEFDDCCLEYINEVRSLLNKAVSFSLEKLSNIAAALGAKFKKYEEAIEIYEHVIKNCITHDPIHAATCLNDMALVKSILKKYNESIEHRQEALNLFQSNGGGQNEISDTFIMIGDQYSCQKKYHDSLKYFEKALEETSKTSKVSRGPNFTELHQSDLWLRIAKTQYELDMPKTALSSIKKAWNYLRIVDDKKHPKECSYIYYIKGCCYRRMGNYKKAITLTMAAIEQALLVYEIAVQAAIIVGNGNGNDVYASLLAPRCNDNGKLMEYHLNLFVYYTFLAGCAKLANDKKCVDKSFEKLIHLLCVHHKNSDELINFLNETRNGSYLVDDQELFLSKLKHVIDHCPLMLSNAPPESVPKLSLYLNSLAISNLLKKSVSQLMHTE
jgi:tetratricopeptide (TPR) repeat protein